MIDVVGCKVKINVAISVYVFVFYIPPQISASDFSLVLDCIEQLNVLYESNFVCVGDFNVP